MRAVDFEVLKVHWGFRKSYNQLGKESRTTRGLKLEA